MKTLEHIMSHGLRAVSCEKEAASRKPQASSWEFHVSRFNPGGQYPVPSTQNPESRIQNRVLVTTVVLLALLFVSKPSHAQQDPIYASYMLNPLTINPAYAGSNNMLNATVQFRTQWAGLDANPTTINFSSHTSLLRNKLGAGLMVIQDKLGDTKNTEFQGVFAYKIQLSDSWLSFGMQTGFIRYETDPSMLAIRDPGDPAFTQLTETKFNTGVGLLLKSDKYILGLSVPRLLPATVSQGGQSIELYQQTYYLFGSYAWLLNEKIRFKPSVLMRGTQGNPLSFDVNATITFKEVFTGGLFTRNFKTYGLLTQMIVNKFRLGYVFELPTGSSNLNFTTHEITVGIGMHVLTFHDRALKTF